MPCRCADCGFLAVRVVETRQVVEVEAEMRQAWEFPGRPNNLGDMYQRHPICFVFAADLRMEADRGETIRRDIVTAVITKERECERFTPWMHGRSPLEHDEMLRHLQLQVESQRLADAQRERDLAWQAEQRRHDKEREDRQRSEDQTFQAKQNRWNRFFELAAAMIGAAVGFALAKM